MFLCRLPRDRHPADHGCFWAYWYFVLFLLTKVVTLKTTGCEIAGYILKTGIRDVLCRHVPEKFSFKWLPLLVVPGKIEPALCAAFVPVAEILQGT